MAGRFSAAWCLGSSRRMARRSPRRMGRKSRMAGSSRWLWRALDGRARYVLLVIQGCCVVESGIRLLWTASAAAVYRTRQARKGEEVQVGRHWNGYCCRSWYVTLVMAVSYDLFAHGIYVRWCRSSWRCLAWRGTRESWWLWERYGISRWCVLFMVLVFIYEFYSCMEQASKMVLILMVVVGIGNLYYLDLIPLE